MGAATDKLLLFSQSERTIQRQLTSSRPHLPSCISNLLHLPGRSTAGPQVRPWRPAAAALYITTRPTAAMSPSDRAGAAIPAGPPHPPSADRTHPPPRRPARKWPRSKKMDGPQPKCTGIHSCISAISLFSGDGFAGSSPLLLFLLSSSSVFFFRSCQHPM